MEFEPIIIHRALAQKVLAVAKERIEGTWAAYIDAVPGENHEEEQGEVLRYGCKLREAIARILFPQFDGMPYSH